MEQPQKTNIDPANRSIELDGDLLEQVTGGGINLPGLYEQVGVRVEGVIGNRTTYPIYKNRITGNEHVQYPDGVRKYTSG
jgi:hypothetical protein